MINKKSILLLFTIVIFFIFRFEIKASILEFSNNYRMSFIGLVDFVLDKKDKYFTQINTIEILQKENDKLLVNNFKYIELKEEIKKYDNFYTRVDLKMKPVKVLSLIKLGNLNKYWISKPLNTQLDDEKNYGIVDNNHTYGIAKLDNKNLKLTTNLDSSCVYAVYLGKSKIPGIIFGNNTNMIIKFIPTWMEPKVGDMVYTSGLDNIFYRGISVGTVSKIIKNEQYISAEVDIESKNKIKDFLHLILLDY